MSKPKKSPQRTGKPQEDDNPYKINTSAVDKLVDASEGKVEKVDESEVNQYKSGKLQKIPTFIKAIFIKWWFAGACCFFFLWGLGAVITDQLTLLFVFGFGLGVVTDILTNNFLRFLESSRKEYDKWIVFPWRKWWTIFLSIAVSYGLLFLVVKTYDLINIIIINAQGLEPTSVPLGVEPLLFGVIYVAYEVALVWLRNLVVFIINKLTKKQETEELM